MVNITRDEFLGGQLSICQQALGYRFSIDAVLLARHIVPKAGMRLVDLGTGCGIVPLLLALKYPETEFVGVELQEELADLAHRNVDENQMAHRIRIVKGDLRDLTTEDIPFSVDWVLSNPPYRKAGTGRINPARQKAIAMHEIMVELSALIRTAAKFLGRGGKFSIIYPAERTAELLGELQLCGLAPKRIRCVHPAEGADANRIIVESVKGANPGTRLLPPLYVYGPDGDYHREVAEMLETNK